MLCKDPTWRPLSWAVRYVLSIRTNAALIIASARIKTFAVLFMRSDHLLARHWISAWPVVAGAANPPLDAARLDIIDSRMWGRAESVRAVLAAGLVLMVVARRT